MTQSSQEEPVKYCHQCPEVGVLMHITMVESRSPQKMWECVNGHSETIYTRREEGEA